MGNTCCFHTETETVSEIDNFDSVWNSDTEESDAWSLNDTSYYIDYMPVKLDNPEKDAPWVELRQAQEKLLSNGSQDLTTRYLAIRNYEVLKHEYYRTEGEDEAIRLMSEARECERPVEERKKLYKTAIRYRNDLDKKRQWKTEYNRFYTMSTNKLSNL